MIRIKQKSFAHTKMLALIFAPHRRTRPAGAPSALSDPKNTNLRIPGTMYLGSACTSYLAISDGKPGEIREEGMDLSFAPLILHHRRQGNRSGRNSPTPGIHTYTYMYVVMYSSCQPTKLVPRAMPIPRVVGFNRVFDASWLSGQLHPSCRGRGGVPCNL